MLFKGDSMPVKKTITKNMIIDNAISLIETDGFDSINARSIANKLKCSTQPIYLSFQNMNELKKEVLQEAWKRYFQYINSNIQKEGSLYMNSLTSYINFARNHKHLFELLFFKTKYIRSQEAIEHEESIILGIMQHGNYSYQNAKLFYLQSFLFAHGIACQIVTGFNEYTEKEVNELLEENFKTLKNQYGNKNGSNQNN